jgi:hypothetical protein
MPQGRGPTLPFAITYSSAGIYRLDSLGLLGMAWRAESFSDLSEPYGQGGWGYSYAPTLSGSTWTTTEGADQSLVYCNFYSNYTFTDLSGAGHNLLLGWVSSTPVATNTTVAGGGCGSITASAGDAEVTASGPTTNWEFGAPAIYVYDAAGTTYTFYSPAPAPYPPSSIEDRNGNEINTFTWPASGYPLGYTDTLGRPVVSVTGTGASGTTDTVQIGGLSYGVQWTSVAASYTVPSNEPVSGIRTAG